MGVVLKVLVKKGPLGTHFLDPNQIGIYFIAILGTVILNNHQYQPETLNPEKKATSLQYGHWATTFLKVSLVWAQFRAFRVQDLGFRVCRVLGYVMLPLNEGYQRKNVVNHYAIEPI